MSQPYPTYPGNIVPVAERILTILTAALPTITFPGLTLDATHIMYGDQDMIPKTPFICVEPSEKRRELQGNPNMAENLFEVYIMVYHNKIQGNQTTRRECDQLAYDLEQVLHQDLQLTAGTPADPMMIYGCVLRNESGYTFKQSTLYRTARVTWSGRNKTSLPFA